MPSIRRCTSLVGNDLPVELLPSCCFPRCESLNTSSVWLAIGSRFSSEYEEAVAYVHVRG